MKYSHWFVCFGVVCGVIAVSVLTSAQEAPGGKTTYEVQLTPEVAPYSTKIESFYRVMELLVNKPGGLEVSDYESVKQLLDQSKQMEEHLRQEVQEHDFLDVLVGSVAVMIKDLEKASTQLEQKKLTAATQSLTEADKIAKVLYEKPVMQLVVAEQKTDAAVKLMNEKRYEDAEVVLNQVIDRLSNIPVPNGAPYAADLEQLKSNVLALRRQASEKSAGGDGMQKVVKAIETSFNTTHESVFGGVWSGPVDMSTLR